MEEKPVVALNLRLPKEVHRWLTEQARKQVRTLNEQIVYLLRQAQESHVEW